MFISVGISCEFAMIPDVYILAYFGSTFIKKIKIFTCHYIFFLGNTSKIHGKYEVTALSLVLLVSNFDKVIHELRKTQTGNSNEFWCL